MDDEAARTAAGGEAAVVAGARRAFDTGRTRTEQWRADQIRGLVRFCEEREAEIAEALHADLGRDPFDAWLGEVAATKGEARFALRHLRAWMKPQKTRVPLALRPGKGSYVHEPRGTVLVIGPWNYPVGLCLSPMVGALAAGNAVVVKPSEGAPASSALMARRLREYLDPEAVRVVEGGAETTQALIGAGVDLVFFTGGTEVGRKVMAGAAARLTPVVLELGGKSPAVVTRHARLDVAARRIVAGKLGNSGQICVAPDYVLVEDEVKQRFVDELVQAYATMRAGEPDAQPVVDERHHRRLQDMLGDGTVALGGTSSPAQDGGKPGLAPTVLVDPPETAKVMVEEVFGPILPVVGVRDLASAIGFVNGRDKPLAAYLFSDDQDETRRFIAEVPCGGVVINHTLLHVAAPQLPFGGVGSSGMGSYHGRWGFEAFSHRKAVLAMRSSPDPKFAYRPFTARKQRVLRRVLEL